MLVFVEGIGRADVATLRSLPGVETIGHLRQFQLVRPDGEFLNAGGAVDDVMFRDIDRFRIVDGRAPDPATPEEVVVPEPLARQTGLRVGETVPVRASPRAGPRRLLGLERSPRACRVRPCNCTSSYRTPADRPQSAEPTSGNLLVQRSFVERYSPRIGVFSDERGGVLFVRLRDGSGVDRFVGQLDACSEG